MNFEPITIGRIVLYTLTVEDTDEIFLCLPPMKSGFDTPAFCAGETFPMIVTKKGTDGAVDGMVFLGSLILKKEDIYGCKGDLKAGCWTWPRDVPAPFDIAQPHTGAEMLKSLGVDLVAAGQEAEFQAVKRAMHEAQKTEDWMPRYRCHKVVRAAKIKTVEKLSTYDLDPNPEVEIVFEGGQKLVVGLLWARQYKVAAGGYLVEYEDGYRSWSPAKAFEEGYTQIDENAANMVKIPFWKPAVPIDQLPAFTEMLARLLVSWGVSTKPKSGVIALKQPDGSELVFTQE